MLDLIAALGLALAVEGILFAAFPEGMRRAMYEAADVTPDKLVIAYCSSGVRSAATYLTLRALGYEQVKLYSASFDEWSNDPTRPVEI